MLALIPSEDYTSQYQTGLRTLPWRKLPQWSVSFMSSVHIYFIYFYSFGGLLEIMEINTHASNILKDGPSEACR